MARERELPRGSRRQSFRPLAGSLLWMTHQDAIYPALLRPLRFGGAKLPERAAKRSATTMTGRFSGSRYRSAATGAKMQFKLRDVASLSGLPNLRRLE
jgi:hypothetical protein